MQAEQCVREGKLDEALADLERAIRDDPATARYRVFLFQLLAVMGNWDRALTQLAVLQDMDVSMLPLVMLYRDAVQSEAFRTEVFAGQRQPVIFGEPGPWVAYLMESLKAVAQERHGEATKLREQALEMAPAVAGTLTCRDQEPAPFEWICDADSRLGPMLEVIVNGKYFWVPFERISSIAFDDTEDLRDLVWAPVHFRWSNGGECAGLIPTRYPGSELSPDPQVQLSRLTDWSSPSDGVSFGLGQRMLATDRDDYALLQVDRIDLNTESA